MRPRLISAARILVVLNGRIYGLCGGISWSANSPKRAARGVDVPYVQEYMPTTFEVTGSLSIYRTLGDGGLEGQGLQAAQIDQSKEKYITIQLVERDTEESILEINQAVIENQSWNAIAKGLLMGNISFRGIIFTNQATG